MEIVLLIAVLVLVILVFTKQDKHLNILEKKAHETNFLLDDLRRQITLLQNNLKQGAELAIKEEKITPFETITQETIIKEEETPIIPEEETNEQEQLILEQVQEVLSQEIEENKEVEEESAIIIENTYQVIEPAKPSVVEEMRAGKIETPKKSWYDKFKEKNPDLEKFIGENLINKIGILILVLGISFFVKYAIDKDWINEPARVGIGILSGTIVLGIAHRLRKLYAAFSSVFVAGAISIYYLTIGIAYHDYQLFDQTVAFIIMVVITVFSTLVSISYNRKELAVLSLIGGFAVPFMVSSGDGNYNVLFTYIAVLNVGMLILAYFKKWNLVTILAFIFTCILYASWFTIEFGAENFPYAGAFIYASVFYFIFSLAPVVNNIRNNGNFSIPEYGIMLINTFFYFIIGANILNGWQPEMKGLFTISLALYNLLYSFVLYKQFGVNKNAIYFLLGLSLTFITLTIPFQFEGNYITLFWACEAVLLLWLSQKSKIATFKIGGIVVQILMIFSLIIDWMKMYGNADTLSLNPFINNLFITGLVALASLVATYYLLKKEKENTVFYFININPTIYKQIALIFAIIIGYFVGILEISYQANIYVTNFYSVISFSILYHYVFSTIIIAFLFKNKNIISQSIGFVLACINIAVYLAFTYSLTNKEMVDNFTYNTDSNVAFIIHYFILACVAYTIYLIYKHRKDDEISTLVNTKAMMWIFVCCVVYILSSEITIHGLFFSSNIIDRTALETNYPISEGLIYAKEEFVNTQLAYVKTQILKIGYPILWGILSFIFLIVGIQKQNKQLRIAALSLLGLTILKLFIFDIKNVSETGKIVAFILLGVLILIISFVYQKIKKLVIDDNQTTENEDNK